MTDEWERRGLELVTKELEGDATFLAGWLPDQPDGRTILRKRLGLDSTDWNRLLLCRPPMPSTYWDDVLQIANHVHADPVDLARGLREVAALAALRSVTAVTADARPLAAARDAAAETIAIEPSPRARLQELAEQFWEKAGGNRDVQRAASISLPLAVTFLPKLGLSSVSSWLHSYGVAYDPREQDRPLRGLLIATRGLGMVFIDGSAAETDRRFTLAHEIGHFLIDYLEPRRRVLDEMPELAGVIDGERRPTKGERAKAMLQRVPIGTYTYLIERDPHGGAASHVEDAEDEATLLAMELLAPWDESLDTVRTATQGIDGFDEAVGAATHALASRFDLPADVARARARACLSELGRHRGLFDR